MPARTLFFTFNKDIELNKSNIKALKDELEAHYEDEDLQKLKDAFSTEELDKNFFKFLFKEIKLFDTCPIEGTYCSQKTKAILDFVYDEVSHSEGGGEESTFGFKYLFDEWDYEGCGYDDHYHLSFSDMNKEIKKFTKEAQRAVDKLQSMGVNIKLVTE